MVDLPDQAVGVMRDRVRQAIAIAELFLSSISQQAHWGWNLRTDGAHLPQAGGGFPHRSRVLAGQFMHEAHRGISVGEAQVFDGLGKRMLGSSGGFLDSLHCHRKS